jgi:hypothetical protein
MTQAAEMTLDSTTVAETTRDSMTVADSMTAEIWEVGA